jgi:hypothetical protein
MKKIFLILCLLFIGFYGFSQLNKYVTKTGAQTLTNKTLTSPKINENVTVTVTATDINKLTGLTGNVQSQITTQNDSIANRFTKTQSDNRYLNKTGITVSDEEINRLDNASSNIQEQFNTINATLIDTMTLSDALNIDLDTDSVATKSELRALNVTGTSDSIRVLPTVPTTGNVYINEGNGAVWYKNHISGFWSKPVMAADSINPVYEGVVAVWEFDETSGTTATDTYGTHDGTLVNGTANNQAGKIGQCLDLDGTDDYVTLTNSADFQLTSFSISMWVYIDAAPEDVGVIIGKNSPNWYTSGYSLEYNSFNNLIFRVSAMTPSNIYYTMITGAWHHVVATFTGSHSYLYIDGSLVADAVQTGTISNMSSLLTLGKQDENDKYLNFKADQTIVWSRAIVLTEVSFVNNNGNGRAYP